MSVDPSLPSLAGILSTHNYAAIARELGKPRAWVWRLARGGPLMDYALIPDLARVLRLPASQLRRIVDNDRARRARRAGVA